MLDYRSRIRRDPNVCGGQPAIKGTRIRVKVVLDNLAEGHLPEDIIKSYSGLAIEDVKAVIAFAAAATAADLVYPLPAELGAQP